MNTKKFLLFVVLPTLLVSGVIVGLYFGEKQENYNRTTNLLRVKVECYENAQAAGLSGLHCAQLGK